MLHAALNVLMWATSSRGIAPGWMDFLFNPALLAIAIFNTSRQRWSQTSTS
jgi:hypothetical protein